MCRGSDHQISGLCGNCTATRNCRSPVSICRGHRIVNSTTRDETAVQKFARRKKKESEERKAIRGEKVEWTNHLVTPQAAFRKETRKPTTLPDKLDARQTRQDCLSARTRRDVSSIWITIANRVPWPFYDEMSEWWRHEKKITAWQFFYCLSDIMYIDIYN